jgi:glycosyltransferase involved in cell wall biosynthesis
MPRSEKIKVLFLSTINPGVCFYRQYQFAQKMSELGLARCRIFPEWNPSVLTSPDWERKLDQNLGELEAQVEWADIIVCQYINSPEGLSIVQAMRDIKPTLMEVDDDFKHVPHQSIAYEYNKPGEAQDLWATRQMMESTGVVVSTPYLVNYFKEFNSNIKCIPNCIDFNLWDKYQPTTHPLLRVGWIGGATHEGDLRLVKDALFSLLLEHQNIEIFIVSAPPPKWSYHERLHLVSQWVNIDKYAQHVKELSFDIGIVPLRDNLFNRGKSNLRALEYSACGIPTVASWVEPFKNGLPVATAKSYEFWVTELNKLISDEEDRRQRGFASYEYVKEFYNLDKVAVMYADYLKDYL